jgi:hypothetical protein
MQSEIELLIMAIHQEQARETKLLDSILASISEREASRKKMTQDIVIALDEATEGSKQDENKRRMLAGEIENVITMMRKNAA